MALTPLMAYANPIQYKMNLTSAVYGRQSPKPRCWQHLYTAIYLRWNMTKASEVGAIVQSSYFHLCELES